MNLFYRDENYCGNCDSVEADRPNREQTPPQVQKKFKPTIQVLRIASSITTRPNLVSFEVER
jgi:hypothetical protein